MEIRLKIEDKDIQPLMTKLGANSANEVAREALSLLGWAVDEAGKNRVILSTNEDGGDVHRLVTPALSKAKTQAAE
jgi:hypothetical protein